MDKFWTEDEVRDKASEILGLKKNTQNVIMGMGQLTTFNQFDKKSEPLMFGLVSGISDKPDGSLRCKLFSYILSYLS